jgi:hypothetical protein
MTVTNAIKDLAGDFATECSKNSLQIVKIKAAGTYVALLARLRKASFILFLSIFCVILACFSFVLALAVAVLRASLELPVLDPLLYLGSCLFLISGLACVYCNSERVWIKFGEVDRILEDLKQSQ